MTTACPSVHLFLQYRVYQKEVNSLKNDSKLKSMKYLVKILFHLDKKYEVFGQSSLSLR